ncbi:MAG: DUF6062 family protein [Candidatus Hadarchaeum sp.]
MSKGLAYYALRDALPEPGCAVCRLKATAIERYLSGLLWESVNDPGVRCKIRQAQGFCFMHAWELARGGALLGIALLMRDVLQNALETLYEVYPQPLAAKPLRQAVRDLFYRRRPALGDELEVRLTPRASCPACAQGEEMECIYLDILVGQLLGKDSLLSAYEASDGLCLPHFRQAVARARDEEVLNALVNAQRRIWERLIGQLSEFIRKNDYRFVCEPLGEESDAWLRAIATVSGMRHESRQ